MRFCNSISKVRKNDNRVRIWERGSDWFAILIASILIRGYSLQYTNSLSLRCNGSVIISAVILVNTSGKQGISNSASSYNTSRIFGPCCSLN